MPRSKTTVDLGRLSREDIDPLVGASGPTMLSALQAIVTWATSTSTREQILTASQFPLAGDLPAFLLINQLVYRGIARPTDLADAMNTGRSNITKIVKRLETHGLVFRATDPRDDRGVIVGLTADGRSVGQRILEALDQQADMSGWEPADLAGLERLLVRLAETLDTLPGRPFSAVTGADLRSVATT